MADRNDGYKLLHRATIALAQVEANGLRVDVPYAEKTIKRLDRKIQHYTNLLLETPECKEWKKAYGPKMNLGSGDQLADIIYNKLGYPIRYYTDTGKPATNQKALEALEEEFERYENDSNDFLNLFFRRRKYEKAQGTYLKGTLAEVVDGYVHPSFGLNNVKSFRSCIAGYEKVLVLRENDKNPDGIPIKDVKVGDYVYCFDDNLNPAVKKVLWQGKTGHREVIRVHWRGAQGKTGHFDCTPEHLVRCVDGRYVEAQNLMTKEGINTKRKKQAPMYHVLSCNRSGDYLNFTGHYRNGKGVKEHRLVYEQLVGPLEKEKGIHHKDWNHYNNNPKNLQKVTKREHASIHGGYHLQTPEARKKNVEVVKRLHKEGHYDHVYRRGEDAHNYKGLSRGHCIRMLAKCGGHVKYAADLSGTDFDTFKKYLKKHGIDWKIVALRYDKNRKYISRGRLASMVHMDPRDVRKIIGHNFYRYKDLCRYYGFPVTDRKKKGRTSYTPVEGNHVITKIEWLGKTEDVYDIEVEDCHNFFVNEICVHNSATSPNIQNASNRNKEISKIVRRMYIPRAKNRHIVEIDYSSLEVRIGACYHQDPKMITYIKDPSTCMHYDAACDMYMLPRENVSKDLRQTGKVYNFSECYGSWYPEVAMVAWETCKQEKLKTAEGVDIFEHLKSKGITELGPCNKKDKPLAGTFEHHIMNCERILWEERFPVYNQWRKQVYRDYQRDGFFTSKNGFVYSGYMKKNEVINYAVQGSGSCCTIWSLCEIQDEINRRGMKTCIIGEVHDSIIADVPSDELELYTSLAYEIMTNRLRDTFDWIIVPIEVEADVAPEGLSWYDKQAYGKFCSY